MNPLPGDPEDPPPLQARPPRPRPTAADHDGRDQSERREAPHPDATAHYHPGPDPVPSGGGRLPGRRLRDQRLSTGQPASQTCQDLIVGMMVLVHCQISGLRRKAAQARATSERTAEAEMPRISPIDSSSRSRW